MLSARLSAQKRAKRSSIRLGLPVNQAAEILVEQNLSLVEALARKILKKLPSFVELEDLVGFGQLGLVEASRRFDPTRGVLFKTFAYYRIRGAIFDGIRKMSWFKGAGGKEVTFAASSNEVLRESAEEDMGSGRRILSVEEQIERTRDLIENIAAAKILSLDADESPVEIARDEAGPDEIAEVADLSSVMRDCVSKLDEKERIVIEGYYFNHLTLEEAGAKIGLSKSWTCRLHARALKKLLALCRECGIEGAA